AANASTLRVGSVPLRPAGSRILGSLAPSSPVRLTVALAPRDPAALAAFATAVATPGSSVFRQRLSVAQFAERFGAPGTAIAAVRTALTADGLALGPVSANHLAIPVSGAAADVEHAFSTTLARVGLTDGRIADANSTPLFLGASVAPDVQAIIGLSTTAAAQPLAVSRRGPWMGLSPHLPTGGPQPCSAASAGGGTTADQIAAAYGYSPFYAAGDLGAGETIGLYESEPNFSSDITAFEQCYGITAPVSYVEVDGGPGGSPGGANQNGSETELDADAVLGLAPAANVLIYQGPGAGSGPYDIYNAMVSQDRANVISTSWGICDPEEGRQDAVAENTLFNEAAAQGQSVIASAGDDGAQDCYQSSGTNDTQVAADDPGTQPNVTAVGGTTLTALGPPPTEQVWNDGLGNDAGGGGIAKFWTMPSYQSSAPSSLNVINSESSGAPCGAGSGYCREVPDVSGDADPGIASDFDGSWGAGGGTSLSAPDFAALVALADASSSCHGKQLGFVNPALYAAAASSYSQEFNDVTRGNNDYTGTNGGHYAAGPGFDLASGLGTPIGAALGAGLCSASPVTVTSPGNQSAVVGKAVSVQISGHGASLSYSASGLPPGLSINAATGLISGSPTTAGSYAVTVTAAVAGGGNAETTLTWTVAGPPTVSRASLSGIRAGNARLAFTAHAGPYAPQLFAVSVGLPGGLSWARGKGALARGISVRGAAGKRLSFSATYDHGWVDIVLAHNAVSPVLQVTGGYPALLQTYGLQRRVRQHRVATLTVIVEPDDANNKYVNIDVPLKPS
ncbi:MAG TPA: protease pro-enzyme activation domain-containing protein, partial [Solirubrobacteraceae bacterium]|nr:protease pro-enzyme activation domain-containing protein [Solirubrobacteraceae bacterium]